MKNGSDITLLAAIPDRANEHHAMSVNKGDDALLLRTHLIKTAISEILIQTFIWKNDECGRFLVWELLEAAKRGVPVKILVDTWPGLEFPPLLVFLGSAHPNLELKFYNPPDKQITPDSCSVIKKAITNPEKLNHRMHSKAFIADAKIIIIGGRNHENAYFDRGQGRNFKDREIAIAGPVAGKATEVFFKYWNAKCSYFGKDLKDYKEELEKSELKPDSAKDEYQLNNLFDELEIQSKNIGLIETRFLKEMQPVEQAELVADEPGDINNNTPSPMIKSLHDLIQSADSAVLLQTPYFVLDKYYRDLFRELTNRKNSVDIRISTNSLAATDNVLAYSTALRDRERYISTLKLRIFELCPLPKDWSNMLGYKAIAEEKLSGSKLKANKNPPHKGFHLCLHAKTYIIDDHTTCITSANIDPRSLYINTEMGIIVRDRAFTAKIKANIENDISPGNSWAVAMVPKDQRAGIFGNFTFTWFYPGTPTA